MIIVPKILADKFGASNELIGLVAGAVAAAGFISSYMFGRASDVYGRRSILVLGLMLSGLTTLLQIVSLIWGGLEFFATVRILIGFCSGIFPAALLAYAYDTRAGRMGKFSAFGSAGWGFGNFGVGIFGVMYEEAYLFCALVLFASFAIALTVPFSKEVSECALLPGGHNQEEHLDLQRKAHQAQLHVAARVLAPRCAARAARRALDTPLGHRGLPALPGVCYLAHRRLPGRDSHPLNRRSMQQDHLALAGFSRTFAS